jgi:hypothetical protein
MTFVALLSERKPIGRSRGGRVKLRLMRMKFGLVDVLLILAVATLLYLRNWQAIVFFALVVTCVIVRYYKSKRGEPLADSKQKSS